MDGFFQRMASRKFAQAGTQDDRVQTTNKAARAMKEFESNVEQKKIKGSA